MKQQYRIRNWSEYNAGLKQRGSLTFWVSEDAIDQWLNSNPSGQLGAPRIYSDLAILSVLTVVTPKNWTVGRESKLKSRRNWGHDKKAKEL
ncbi:MAG: hypothetical protein HC851_17430 [Acaryochloris sp. RU_4_1]|nr:hypothetical protein [Acaryochloris sp. RU_4_1]